MKIEVVHASISENGTINGRPGDQTGGEVCKRALYDRDWTHVCRPTDSFVAMEIIKQAKQAAINDDIGYSQADRYSLSDYVSDYELDNLSEVNEPVNCDCSSLVSTIVNMAGVHVSRAMWTGNEVELLRGTGRFRILDYAGAKLLAGDILVAKGHTAIVVTVNSEGPAPAPLVEFAEEFDPIYAGLYRTNGLVNLRSGPGTDRRILRVLDHRDELYNYGYYTIDDRGVIWYLVRIDSDVIGFVSSLVVHEYHEEGMEE